MRSLAPHLFLVLEAVRPLGGGTRHRLDEVDEVLLGRGTTTKAERRLLEGRRALDIRLCDPRVSSVHARIGREGRTWFFQDLGSTNGSRVYGRPATREVLGDEATIELGSTLLVLRTELAFGPSDERDLQGSTILKSAGARPLTLYPIEATTTPLPNLTDRIEDLGLTVASILARIDPKSELKLESDLAHALAWYRWPQGTRELEQVIKQVAANASEGVMRLASATDKLKRAFTSGPPRRGTLTNTQITPIDLADSEELPDLEVGPEDALLSETVNDTHGVAHLEGLGGPESTPRPSIQPRGATSPPEIGSPEDRKIYTELLESLKSHNGNVTHVARALGRTRMQIHRWMNRWNIDINRFRGQ